MQLQGGWIFDHMMEWTNFHPTAYKRTVQVTADCAKSNVLAQLECVMLFPELDKAKCSTTRNGLARFIISACPESHQVVWVGDLRF